MAWLLELGFKPGKVDAVLRGCPALLDVEPREPKNVFDWMVVQLKQQVRLDQTTGTVEIWQAQKLMHIDWVKETAAIVQEDPSLLTNTVAVLEATR